MKYMREAAFRLAFDGKLVPSVLNTSYRTLLFAFPELWREVLRERGGGQRPGSAE